MTTATTTSARTAVDPLALNDVDHVRFYVGNAKQAAFFYAYTFGFQISQSEHHLPLFTFYLSWPQSAGTYFSPVFSSGTATLTLPMQPLSFSHCPDADINRPSGSPSIPSEQSNSYRPFT